VGSTDHFQVLPRIADILLLIVRRSQPLGAEMGKLIKPFGEILIEQGAISQAQLKSALEKQKKNKGKKIGVLLIEMGAINEVDIVSALSKQYNFTYLPLKQVSVSQDVCAMIAKKMAEEYFCIPVDHVKDTLILAMSDPSDEKAISEVAHATKCKVQPFISTISEITTALKMYYREEE